MKKLAELLGWQAELDRLVSACGGWPPAGPVLPQISELPPKKQISQDAAEAMAKVLRGIVGGKEAEGKGAETVGGTGAGGGGESDDKGKLTGLFGRLLSKTKQQAGAGEAAFSLQGQEVVTSGKVGTNEKRDNSLGVSVCPHRSSPQSASALQLRPQRLDEVDSMARQDHASFASEARRWLPWTCPSCTFVNERFVSLCEVCDAPNLARRARQQQTVVAPANADVGGLLEQVLEEDREQDPYNIARI